METLEKEKKISRRVAKRNRLNVNPPIVLLNILLQALGGIENGVERLSRRERLDDLLGVSEGLLEIRLVGFLGDLFLRLLGELLSLRSVLLDELQDGVDGRLVVLVGLNVDDDGLELLEELILDLVVSRDLVLEVLQKQVEESAEGLSRRSGGGNEEEKNLRKSLELVENFLSSFSLDSTASETLGDLLSFLLGRVDVDGLVL